MVICRACWPEPGKGYKEAKLRVWSERPDDRLPRIFTTRCGEMIGPRIRRITCPAVKTETTRDTKGTGSQRSCAFCASCGSFPFPVKLFYARHANQEIRRL